ACNFPLQVQQHSAETRLTNRLLIAELLTSNLLSNSRLCTNPKDTLACNFILQMRGHSADTGLVKWLRIQMGEHPSYISRLNMNLKAFLATGPTIEMRSQRPWTSLLLQDPQHLALDSISTNLGIGPRVRQVNNTALQPLRSAWTSLTSDLWPWAHRTLIFTPITDSLMVTYRRASLCNNLSSGYLIG
ncbi:hypothetical protein BJY01DRAFT_226858, partial [Aspergillus pseudoustus]